MDTYGIRLRNGRQQHRPASRTPLRTATFSLFIRSAVHQPSQHAASAVTARCIVTCSALRFYTSLCCHTRLARMLEDIHPTRLHTLQHRQTRRKRFFQEKENTLSGEKESFPKHSKEAFPSIKGDSYNN